MYSASVEETIEGMQRAGEFMAQRESACEMRSHKAIRSAVSSAFQSLGLNNQIESIYSGMNDSWEIHFSGTLDKEQREAVTKATADKLGIYPENLLMCGLYPN